MMQKARQTSRRHPFWCGKKKTSLFFALLQVSPVSLRVSKFSQIFFSSSTTFAGQHRPKKFARRRVTEKVSIALLSRFCPGGVPTSHLGPRESQWFFSKTATPKRGFTAEARLPPADVDFLHWREAGVGDGWVSNKNTYKITYIMSNWCQLMKVGQESWWLTCWLATRQWLVEDSCPYSWMSITRCLKLVDYSVTRQPFWKPPRSNLTPQHPVGWLEIWDIWIVSHSPPQTHENTAQPKCVNLGSNLIQPYAIPTWLVCFFPFCIVSLYLLAHFFGGIHSPQPQLPWFHIWFHIFGGASFGGALFDLHGQVGHGLCQHVYSGAADGRSRSGGRKFGRERFVNLEIMITFF